MSGAPVRKNSKPGVDPKMLKELRLFRGFPRVLLQQVAKMAVPKRFPAGSEILRQGQVNNKLYFLMEGNVGVEVDGGRVAELRRKGDLLGEMSVITGDPCAATIVAESDVEVIIVDSTVFDGMDESDQDRYQHAMFRVYAINLSDKLRITNEKAKRFEQLNHDLQAAKDELESANLALEKKVKERTKRLEAQYDELAASHKKIENLYRTRDITFDKLEELYKEHLVPLRFTLSSLESAADEHVKKDISEAYKEVDEVMILLEPITRLYKSEKAMESKTVLLLDSNKKQQRVAKMALGGTGVELFLANNEEEAREHLDKHTFDIAFVDSQVLEFINEIHAKNASCDIVVLTSEQIPEFLPRLMNQEDVIPNLVSRDANDRLYTTKNIMTSVTKLAGDDIFGMEKYLGWGVDVQSVDVKNSVDRQGLIEGMHEYFNELSVRRSVLDRCHTVAEELLMNAIYDAPTDEVGKAIYNHLDRTQEIQLSTEHQAKMKYATDGLFVALSVEDPNGALGTSTVLKYLDSCYSGRAGSLNKHKGGAGRGLHQIIENSDFVVFNISRGVKTEVIAFFHVDPKESGDKFPAFHIFVQ